jgi:C-terminal processing protease CtpA/Prc
MTTQQADSEETTSALLLANTDNSSGPSTAIVVTVLQVNQGDEDIDEIPLAATELFSESPQELTPDRRPAFISVTVLKATRRADTGISVEEVEGSLSITNIESEGLFGATPLCVGDSVLSVNNTSCENKSAAFVSRLIKRSRRSVTLVARRPDGDPYIVSTMVTKPKTTSRVGIGLRVVNGCLCVSSIDPSGLFAGGILNVGDKCVSIGGISCVFMDSTSAIQLIRKEKNVVSIVTWTDQEAGVVVAAVSSGRFWIAPWKRMLIMFIIGVTLFLVFGYFLSEKNWTAPTSGGPPPCKAMNGRPLTYSHCQNITRI